MPDINLNPDGPHSPERTRELGSALAETVRCLNYATLRGESGLEHPADAHDLIGALKTAFERMPQLLDQTAIWLEALRASPALGDRYAGTVPGHASTARGAARETIELLAVVAVHVEDAVSLLREAHNATGGLYLQEDSGA